MLRKLINLLLRKNENLEELSIDFNEGELNAIDFTENYIAPITIEEKGEEVKPNENKIIMFEFIPEAQNYRNVRSVLQFVDGDFKSWKSIRDKAEEGSNGVCCICGGVSQKYDKNETTATQCHEVWHFDDKNLIQKLVRLEPLCVCCHNIKHINRFHSDKAKTDELLNRYCSLNQCDMSAALADLEEAKRLKKSRKDLIYKLDLAEVNKFYDEEKFNDLVVVHNKKFADFLSNTFLKNKNIEE
jgi:hypothetical protein